MGFILLGLAIAWGSGFSAPLAGPPTPPGVDLDLGSGCTYSGAAVLADMLTPVRPAPTASSATPTTTPGTTAPAAATRPPTPADRAAFARDLWGFYAFASCNYELNHGLGVATRLTALAFTFLTTIASAFNWRDRGIIFGAVATALVAFQSAFPFDTEAQFYSRIVAQTDRIISDTRFAPDDDPSAFERARQAFERVKEEQARGARATPTPEPTPAVQPSPQPLPASGTATAASPTPVP
jgi:hypothetical protein